MSSAPRGDANVLFRADELPVLQNRVYPTRDEAIHCPKGTLRLAQDPTTGIVSNIAFDPSLIVYDENYQNEQGVSAAFQKHLRDVAAILRQHFEGKKLFEVGCGKALFLEMLRADGVDIIGIDPAYEGTAPYVIRERFSTALGMQRDGIVLRHVLEHIQNPVTFLRAIADANKNRGHIYIEVPCFDWICENRAWFDLFYEHVNYFRASDFRRMFGSIIAQGFLFGGQYQYVIADLATLRDPVVSGAPVSLPTDFCSGLTRACDLARSNPGRRRVVWGGASKGVLFALHLGREGVALDFAIDINPAKQARYLPASGLQVLSPAAALNELQDGDLVFVMNPNYEGEIRTLAGPRFTYHVPS